ncbi:hypothetical protein [Sphingomonas sp.]|uniref:hypothetical protein n=1 Tax=Sphingomonas sp. TaxID=28214 RepID=UPI0031D9D9F9
MTFTATPSPQRFAPALIGGAIAVFLVLLVLLTPGWRLDMAVTQSGLADLLAAAQPPLGIKARLMLALATGFGGGAVAWAATYLLWGPDGLMARRKPVAEDGGEDYVPSVRRSDRHPDAPPRRPLLAAELGVPPPPPGGDEPEEERALPVDLDQPLAAFDPDAILSSPREPVRPVPPLTPESARRPVTPSAGPMPMPAPGGEVADQGAALPRPDAPPDHSTMSIETMLERLERETALRKSGRSN